MIISISRQDYEPTIYGSRRTAWSSLDCWHPRNPVQLRHGSLPTGVCEHLCLLANSNDNVERLWSSPAPDVRTSGILIQLCSPHILLRSRGEHAHCDLHIVPQNPFLPGVRYRRVHRIRWRNIRPHKRTAWEKRWNCTGRPH